MIAPPSPPLDYPCFCVYGIGTEWYCGWKGRIEEAIIKKDDLIRCPVCGTPVQVEANYSPHTGWMAFVE